MLEKGKRYRIKGTDKEFELRQMIGYQDFCTVNSPNYREIAVALATDNYEEVKQKVKKTFYQGVDIKNCKIQSNFHATGWYPDKNLVENSALIKQYGYEIIEREFEVEE